MGASGSPPPSRWRAHLQRSVTRPPGDLHHDCEREPLEESLLCLHPTVAGNKLTTVFTGRVRLSGVRSCVAIWVTVTIASGTKAPDVSVEEFATESRVYMRHVQCKLLPVISVSTATASGGRNPAEKIFFVTRRSLERSRPFAAQNCRLSQKIYMPQTPPLVSGVHGLNLHQFSPCACRSLDLIRRAEKRAGRGCALPSS